MPYHIKSKFTNDFLRGCKKERLEFNTKKEAKRYIRNNTIQENKFKVMKANKPKLKTRIKQIYKKNKSMIQRLGNALDRAANNWA